MKSDGVEEDFSPFWNEDVFGWRSVFERRGWNDGVDDGEFGNDDDGRVES